MKKLVAAVLTGVLVAGTLSTGVYAKDDDKTITVAASATPHAEILEEAKPLLEKVFVIINYFPVTIGTRLINRTILVSLFFIIFKNNRNPTHF